MCGVVGYSGIGTEQRRSQFIRLCREACIRGVHAFGIAYYDGESLIVRKSLDFDQLMDTIPPVLPQRIIFHNRYSTSGDYQVMENNQPIYVEGHALAFNGTVDMGTKAEMEQRSGMTLTTDNDGELVLRDFIDGDPLKRIQNRLTTFAGIFLTPKGEMFALRNEMRPLHVFSVSGGKFLASTTDIALRAKFEENYSDFSLPPFRLTPIV